MSGLSPEIQGGEGVGATASPQPALVPTGPEPVPVSAHAGDGQAQGKSADFARIETALAKCGHVVTILRELPKGEPA